MIVIIIIIVTILIVVIKIDIVIIALTISIAATATATIINVMINKRLDKCKWQHKWSIDILCMLTSGPVLIADKTSVVLLVCFSYMR